MAGRNADTEVVRARASGRRRVVVECRRSKAGRRALEAAARLAREQKALITVVAAVPDGSETARCCGALGGSAWSDLMEAEARAELKEAAGLLRDCGEVEFVVASGSRVAALAESAESAEADAIIVAGRPPRALRKRVRRAALPGGRQLVAS